MILTSTYRQRTGAARDLLAAYSALDHGTTATLPPELLAGAFARLLRRLSVVTALHGSHTPTSFLHALATSTEEIDVVEVAAAFLEHGSYSPLGRASELQQEFVHFSRIVDIGHLGLPDPDATHALHRLRGSDRLPEPLKVLAELVVVARARLGQRGRSTPLPRLRTGTVDELELSSDTTLALPTAHPDFWLGILCKRRRIRRAIRHELDMLLAYLTPVEAALALWAYYHEQQPPQSVHVALVQTDPCNGVTLVQWSYTAQDSSNDDDILASVMAHLPQIDGVPRDTNKRFQLGTELYRIRSQRGGKVIVEQPHTTVEVELCCDDHPRATASQIADRARATLLEYAGPDIVSVEAAHVHLDRDLDVDQEVGAAIGIAAIQHLGAHQSNGPAFVPMLDDDHVLIRLTPKAYKDFLDTRFDNIQPNLVCESSPIVRAIAIRLFDGIRGSTLNRRLHRRGGSLFLQLPDGSHCELFEDVNGGAATGCILFEVALLIYRTAPARFDRFFCEEFCLQEPVHQHAAQILSLELCHDVKVTQLKAYYHSFSALTALGRSDGKRGGSFRALVDDVLTTAEPVVGHLNVLEDYYETQQSKVRQLIALLDLPLRLLSLHFNVATGRVKLDG